MMDLFTLAWRKTYLNPQVAVPISLKFNPMSPQNQPIEWHYHDGDQDHNIWHISDKFANLAFILNRNMDLFCMVQTLLWHNWKKSLQSVYISLLNIRLQGNGIMQVGTATCECYLKSANNLSQIRSLHIDHLNIIELHQDGEKLWNPLSWHKVILHNDKLSSTLYINPTNTDLVMNFHSLVPLKYKLTLVNGFVHRIFWSCSSWQNFHESLSKAKKILENNQCPSFFY